VITTTILAIIWILGVIAAIDVIMHGRTAQGVTAWAIALVIMPAITLPLYMIFGERRFLGYIRARRKGLRPLDQSMRQFLENLIPCVAIPTRPELRSLAKLGHQPFTNGNRVQVLVDGDAMFEEMFRQIDKARRYVLLLFYIYRNDDTGKELQKRLIAARQRGVEVYFMYDEIGSIGLAGEYLQLLEKSGCRCSGFRTQSRRRRRFLRLNFRNHRKIVVVDGRTGLIGGINVGDEYRGRDEAIGPWRDSHAALEGPSVQCLQMVFVEDWYWAQRNVPTDLEWSPAPIEGGTHVLIYPSGPADELETGALLFGQLINSAQERLWIATPYFVPDEFILSSLQLAALRGVDVRLLVPLKGDRRLTTLTGLSYFKEMISAGISISQYRPGFLHQKVILADDTAAIGTANVDNRSMRINFEVTAVIPDHEIATGVERMLLKDFAHSSLVTIEQLDRLTALDRFQTRIARTISPIL